MNIITLPKYAEQAETLDALWIEAESLGRVEVTCCIWDKEYTAEITFTLPSGTRIYAKGKDRVITFALAAAIDEARSLGAGG